MKYLTEWGFHTLGLLVVITGWLVVMMTSLLGMLWLADVLLTKVLRATGSFKIVLRYALLDENQKQKIKDDLAEEERLRKIPYVPPVDDEDEPEGDPEDVVMRVIKRPDQRCECIVLPQGRCGRTPAGLFKLRGWDKAVMSCKRCEEFPHSHDLESDGWVPDLTIQDSPTPAGSVSDSDMLPDAPGSQSREPGESKARQGEGGSDP